MKFLDNDSRIIPYTFSEELLNDFFSLSNYSYSDIWNASLPSDYCDRIENMKLYEKLVLPVLYTLVLLLGLTGNGLMLAVLLSRQKSLRVTEIYLTHLAVADLMFLSTFPFLLVENSVGWVFGDVLCKVVGLLNNLSCLCGSILLACISFDRYMAIVHAVRSLRSRRAWGVHLICMAAWVLCLVLAAPDLVFLSVGSTLNKTAYSCNFFGSDDHSNNWLMTRRIIIHLYFFVPLLVMSCCYSAVVATLCYSQRSMKKQGAIRLSMVITLVFLLCWLPYNVALLVDSLSIWEVITMSCQAWNVLDQVLSVTKSIGYMHSCLNPLLYAFLGVQFRQDLLRLLSRSGCLGKQWRRERVSAVSVSGGAPITTSSLI
ncbi:C-X-C chemokine receptor type 2 isoform X2 [Scleropages formosus]|uniref:C-X-C chemokine receptor type 2 isoform X2 n=1 Tax=Scleropages formosus TaxID=113540 RepID=UPI000878B7F2|nr:C-X-C chemokine receptor type 2-like isoform X2 [Scleropages formosus]